MADAGGPKAELISCLFIFMWLLRFGLEPLKYVIYCTIKYLFPGGLDLGELLFLQYSLSMTYTLPHCLPFYTFNSPTPGAFISCRQVCQGLYIVKY